jgi:hypothetical protein
MSSKIAVTDLNNAFISHVGGIRITRTNCRIALGDVDYAITLAFSVPSYKGYYDVICHGSCQRDCLIPKVDGQTIDLDAAQLAVIIRSQPDYKGQPIRLLSCWVGQYQTGFAHRLSALLGNRSVLACSGRVFIDLGRAYAERGYGWFLFRKRKIKTMRNIP